ncbi:MAG TPA: hypothetical protein VN887_09130, partial [Candidatus Angelobacter sp.]|nr:hypothetical protein [Candidatus Angelobacter sp.]
MHQQPPDRRGRVIELLQLLASEEQQLAYERDVPHVDITAELLCMWFNDLYHPGESRFDSSFTADERSMLASFHQLYEEKSRRLPASGGT